MGNFGWQKKSNCQEYPTKLFFEGFEKAKAPAKARILKICHGCPVRVECKEDAQMNNATGVRDGAYWENGKPIRSDVTKRKFLEGSRDDAARLNEEVFV